jgi:hypothetical protein
MDLPPGEHRFENIEIVGYHDLDGRPGFKMGIHRADDRWYLYMGNLWHRGWTILDVTDPAAPELVRYIEGPHNTWTIQIQVAGGRMIASLEKIDRGWGDDPDAPFEEGFDVWDLADPADPVRLGHFATGGDGVHRNFYDGRGYLHLAFKPAGFEGHIYGIADISDPSEPREVGRWWVPGQWKAGGETGAPAHTGLHHPCIAGDRAYCAFGAAGLVILDISDPASPRMVSRLGFSPPFAAEIAAHTAMPIPGRDLIWVNSEAIAEHCDEPLGFAGFVDVSDETDPRMISWFPTPSPPPGAPFRNFCERGGRFGPHNVHQGQGNPDLLQRDDLLLFTYFNAGLRIVDASDERLLREVGYFLPPDPTERRGVLPRTLVAQSEDVVADARGYVYVTDKNHGVYVLRLADALG